MAELTPERRRKVDEYISDAIPSGAYWPPGTYAYNAALITKTAQLIEAIPDNKLIPSYGVRIRLKTVMRRRLSQALATNNVLAIEELCAELLDIPLEAK